MVRNDAVAARKSAYREGLSYPSTAALSKALITDAKGTPERAWLAEVSAVVLQQALADADRAYKHFFASLKGKRAGARMGPPRFKKRSNMQSVRFTGNARFAVLDNGRLCLPKIGDLKVVWSRELPSVPSSVTVIKTPTGKYYASFVVSVDEGAEMAEPIEAPDAETGIDLGLKSFAVLRGGKVIDSPKFFRYFTSTRLCSACGVLAGPSGLGGLKVRQWVCGCGAEHDRDQNAESNIRCEGKRLVAAGQADT